VIARGSPACAEVTHTEPDRVLALASLDFPMIAGQSLPLDVASVPVLGREKESPAVLRWSS